MHLLFASVWFNLGKTVIFLLTPGSRRDLIRYNSPQAKADYK
jgi:hypothetical protein